ncbi:putative membrane protein YjcL [Chlorella vulgaris]
MNSIARHTCSAAPCLTATLCLDGRHRRTICAASPVPTPLQSKPRLSRRHYPSRTPVVTAAAVGAAHQAQTLLGHSPWGLWCERTKWGKEMSGALLSTLFGLALSNLGVVPAEAPHVYGVVNAYLLPLAVPLLLFAADLRRVLRETGRLLGAFAWGALSTVLGSLLAFKVLPLRVLGADGWKVAAALTARHIGGSVNYVAVSEALSLGPSARMAGLAADDLIVSAYFIALYALARRVPPEPPAAQHAPVSEIASQGSGAAAAAIPAAPQQPPAAVAPAAAEAAGSGVSGSSSSSSSSIDLDGSRIITVLRGATALAVAAVICFAGTTAADVLRYKGGSITLITAITVTLATVFPRLLTPLRASGEGLAAILMQIFFASVGASGSIRVVMQTAPALFLWSAIAVSTHVGLVLAGERLWAFTRKESCLASNANIGGPTTAAGMAAAKGWRSSLGSITRSRAAARRTNGGAASSVCNGDAQSALALLNTPGLPQSNIISHLDIMDKLSLGATCTSLQQASLAWFLDVVNVTVKPGSSDVSALSAWLERRQAAATVKLIWPHIDYDSLQSGIAAVDSSLRTLPPSLITALSADEGLPAAASMLTALTRLEVAWRGHMFFVNEMQSQHLLQLQHLCATRCSMDCLREVATAISRLTRLTSLCVQCYDSDEVERAPSWKNLHALTALQELSLQECSLTRVPRAVPALASLTSLDLSCNTHLELRPVFAPQQLQLLHLVACALTAVPEQVSALTALTNLELCMNGLATGWEHLKPLARLCSLSLSHCGLTSVPEQLAALVALTWLDLARNSELEGGWQHLHPLVRLRHLDLSLVSIELVPEQLSALTALTFLDLSANETLAGGWQHLGPLSQLRTLKLSECDMESLPRQLSALTALTRLDLDCCEHGSRSWRHLRPLVQLRELRLAYCYLPKVPRALTALTALTGLSLTCNRGIASSTRLCQLTQLQYLDLSSCHLTTVPQQLSALTRLTALDLSHNERIAGGWQHLQLLTCLQQLKVHGVPLPDGQRPSVLADLLHLQFSWEPQTCFHYVSQPAH